jgi:hypothetical protein
LLSLEALSQQTPVSGVIIDRDSHTPIPFVNVAIRDKFIGTVTDSLGYFAIESNLISVSDSLIVSRLGYKSLMLRIGDLKSDSNVFLLEQTALDLDEFTITSQSIDRKLIFGSNKLKSQFAFAFNPTKSRASENFGREVAILVNLKNNPAILQNVNFVLGTNQIEDLVLRVNIYRAIKEGDEQPGDRIYEKIVILKNKSEGLYKASFLNNEIVFSDKFWVSVEFVNFRDENELGIITLPVRFPFGKMFTRESSLAEWKEVKGIPSIQVEMESLIK